MDDVPLGDNTHVFQVFFLEKKQSLSSNVVFLKQACIHTHLCWRVAWREGLEGRIKLDSVTSQAKLTPWIKKVSCSTCLFWRAAEPKNTVEERTHMVLKIHSLSVARLNSKTHSCSIGKICLILAQPQRENWRFSLHCFKASSFQIGDIPPFQDLGPLENYWFYFLFETHLKILLRRFLLIMPFPFMCQWSAGVFKGTDLPRNYRKAGTTWQWAEKWIICILCSRPGREVSLWPKTS